MKEVIFYNYIICYKINDLILALLFVRGQLYWPEAEGRRLIRLHEDK